MTFLKPFYWHSRQSLVLTSPGTSWQAWRHPLQCFTVKIKTQHSWAQRKAWVILFFSPTFWENRPDRIRKMAQIIFISFACFKCFVLFFDVFVVWIFKESTFNGLPVQTKNDDMAHVTQRSASLQCSLFNSWFCSLLSWSRCDLQILKKCIYGIAYQGQRYRCPSLKRKQWCTSVLYMNSKCVNATDLFLRLHSLTSATLTVRV